jgi:hypothetical protein
MKTSEGNLVSLERWGVWAVVVPSAIVLLGGLIASWYSCVDWFSRSGALLIAFLLLSFGLDRRKNGGLERQIKSEIDLALSEMGMESLEEYPLAGSFTNQYLPELERADRFLKAELVAGAIATLIWGFGDLVVKGICNALL